MTSRRSNLSHPTKVTSSRPMPTTLFLKVVISNGKMRMVPPMLMAKQAFVDVNEFLRGQLKGKGGGYHAPKLDPFIRSRMEGIRAFLSLFTNPNSNTYNKWAASSLQASISIGHGTYCAWQL